MFRIESIKNMDKDDIFVCFNNSDRKRNYFTIITGENGCGKSSLLSKAVNTFIFNNNEKSNECKTCDFSESMPAKVVAICNARYNRFASHKTYIRESKVFYPNYYIQNEHNLEVGRSLIALMQSVLKEVIVSPSREKIITKRSLDHVDGIRNAFEMIGLEPSLTMNLEFNKGLIQSIRKIYSSEKTERSLKNDNSEHYQKEHFYWRKIAGFSDDLINDLFSSYDCLCKIKTSIGTIKLHLDKGYHQLTHSILHPDLVLAAVISGFLIPTKLQVQRKNSLKWVSNHSLSSGQQSMLMNAIIISTFSTKDALICIDEPENSLHPEWQLSYMTFINALCPSNLGCHFLIATHSPQIISGLQSENGSVVSLIEKEVISTTRDIKYVNNERDYNSNVQELQSASSFIRNSADRQLLDVFKSPGFRNESVIHRMLLILTKLTKKIRLNIDDEKYIEEIYKFIINGKIEGHDPVVVIYNQVKAIRNVRAHDDN
ncbi:ATP-binding protein [Klebsiella aerogenes]